MKKIIAMFVFFVTITSTALAYTAGGFNDGTNSLVTVKEASKMPDNSYVTLKGNIVKRLTSDEYLFKDNTGTINVEIDLEKWMGQTAGPNDTLEITGEVDKDFTSTKIDVDIVKVIPKK